MSKKRKHFVNEDVYNYAQQFCVQFFFFFIGYCQILEVLTACCFFHHYDGLFTARKEKSTIKQFEYHPMLFFLQRHKKTFETLSSPRLENSDKSLFCVMEPSFLSKLYYFVFRCVLYVC